MGGESPSLRHSRLVTCSGVCFFKRDGPLEKWWGGGGGEKKQKKNSCKGKRQEKKFMQRRG